MMLRSPASAAELGLAACALRGPAAACLAAGRRAGGGPGVTSPSAAAWAAARAASTADASSAASSGSVSCRAASFAALSATLPASSLARSPYASTLLATSTGGASLQLQYQLGSAVCHLSCTVLGTVPAHFSLVGHTGTLRSMPAVLGFIVGQQRVLVLVGSSMAGATRDISC